MRGPDVPKDTTNRHLVSQIDLLPTICEIAGADASGVDGRSILSVLRDPAAPFRQFLLIEAEERGWHSVRMRRWNEARADYDNLLFVKWRDGFEELYDYADDPYLYNGRVNTSREQEYLGEAPRHRTAAGDQYRSLETT